MKLTKEQIHVISLFLVDKLQECQGMLYEQILEEFDKILERELNK